MIQSLSELRRKMMVNISQSWFKEIPSLLGDDIAYIDTLITYVGNHWTKCIFLSYVDGNYNQKIAGIANINASYSQLDYGGTSHSIRGCYKDRNTSTSTLGQLANQRPWHNRYVEVTWWAQGAWRLENGQNDNHLCCKDLVTGNAYFSNNEGTSTNSDNAKSVHFPIFAWNNAYSIQNLSSHLHLRSFTLYAGTNDNNYGLKWDGIACQLTRNIPAELAWDGNPHSKGELGMYDSVSGKFFGNANNSGAFRIGTWINE